MPFGLPSSFIGALKFEAFACPKLDIAMYMADAPAVRPIKPNRSRLLIGGTMLSVMTRFSCAMPPCDHTLQTAQTPRWNGRLQVEDVT